MPRRLRYVPPGGALVEVTCRTLQARLLLRPSPILSEITLGILGRAQRLSGVAIHAFVFLANHYHLLVSVSDAAQLAKFVGFLNSNLAREVGRIHEWKERLWGHRYEAILVSEEEVSQVERLLYLARQGCKEGLVSDPLEWPGATSWHAMLDGCPLEGTWFDRTAEGLARRSGIEFEARAFANSETVVLSPLPAWAHLEPEVQRERLRELLDLARAEAEAMRQETGREPLGRDAVVRQDPHRSPARSKQGPAPLVHAASREVRRAYREAFRIFTAAYRRAAEALRAGVEAVVFPEGCFPPPGPFRKPATA
ncbi:MAG TPA: transposase [Thermoanaerobaculia bacterium]|nr:transposase [Thermoanaerobaculia bacterium]